MVARIAWAPLRRRNFASFVALAAGSISTKSVHRLVEMLHSSPLCGEQSHSKYHL